MTTRRGALLARYSDVLDVDDAPIRLDSEGCAFLPNITGVGEATLHRVGEAGTTTDVATGPAEVTLISPEDL